MTAPVGERVPALDPRIRARRREVQRHEGRRRLRRLQAGLAVVAAGAGAWGVALSPLADVDAVQVRGAERTGAGAVEEASGIDHGEAMVALDLAAAAEAVEALPWVRTATVARRWPGYVTVTVAERRPVAVVTAVEGSRLAVDGDGRLLAVVDDGAFPELPRLVGPTPPTDPGATLGRPAHAALRLAELLAVAVPSLASEVTVAEGELEAHLRMATGESTRVLLGREEGLADKVVALAALVDAGVLQSTPAPSVVDVRVPDAPVLTRSQG